MKAQRTLPETPAPVEEHPAPKPAAPRPKKDRFSLLGKRRRFLVDGGSQLRTGAIVTGVALLLVILLNFSLHTARIHATNLIATESPQLRAILEAQNRFELLLGIAASLVFLMGIFVVTILETHKTAGAAYHLCRELERIRDGVYGIRVRLRKGDHLRDIEVALNDMTRALAERATLEVQELEHAASVATRIESPMEAADLAKTLHGMADDRRRVTARR